MSCPPCVKYIKRTVLLSLCWLEYSIQDATFEEAQAQQEHAGMNYEQHNYGVLHFLKHLPLM